MGKKLNSAKNYVLKNQDWEPTSVMANAGVSVATAYAAIKDAKTALKEARESLQSLKSEDTVVGVIADTHIPFIHDRYLDFVVNTFKRFGVTEIVHIGDIVDQHAGSRWNSELEAMNVVEELKLTKKALKPWIKAFPKMKVCLGNHDKIPTRQAKAVGISEHFLKPFNELYELPDAWDCKSQHIIDDVVYEHGVGSGGMYGAKNTAISYGKNYVQGHTHRHAGVYYHATMNGPLFGMNVGCGISSETYATNYTADMVGKVNIACGVVIGGIDAIVIHMRD